MLEPHEQIETGASALEIDSSALIGMELAIRYARGGRLISAMKFIELANPWLTREQVKAVVNSLGYGDEFKWPEEQKLPVRCL